MYLSVTDDRPGTQAARKEKEGEGEMNSDEEKAFENLCDAYLNTDGTPDDRLNAPP